MRITNLYATLVLLALNLLPGAQQAISASAPSQKDLAVAFPPIGIELGEIQKTYRVLPVGNGVYVYSGTVASLPFASMVLVENGKLAQAWISILSVGDQFDIDYWHGFMGAMNIPLADPKEVQEEAYCLGYAATFKQELNPFKLGKSGNTYFEGVQRLVGRGYSIISFRMTSYSNNHPVLKGYFKQSSQALSAGGQAEGANVLRKYIEQVFSPPESRDECRGPLGRVSGPLVKAGLTTAQSKNALVALIAKRQGIWTVKVGDDKVFARSRNESEPEIALMLGDDHRSYSYREIYIAKDVVTCTKLYKDLNTTRTEGHVEVRHRYVKREADGYSFTNTNYFSSSYISQEWLDSQSHNAECKIELGITLPDPE